MQNCGIYSIFNLWNERFYIGCSEDITSRWSRHISSLNSGTHHNKALQTDWDKYGENNFEFKVIEVVEDKRKLKLRELFVIQEYILKFDLYNVDSIKDQIVYHVCRYFSEITDRLYVDYKVKIEGKYYNFNVAARTDDGLYLVSLLNPTYDEQKTKLSRDLKLKLFDELEEERKMVIMEYYPNYDQDYVENYASRRIINFFAC